MSETALSPSRGGWWAHIPDHVPDHMVRYYLYWKIFFFLGGVGHLIVLLMFWQIGVTLMALFNIGSVIIFAIAFVLLRNGVYQPGFWGVNFELIAHGMAATVCIGPQYGYNLFPFLVVVLAFIQPFYSYWVSAALGGFSIFCAVIVTWYATINPPLYEVPDGFVTMMTLIPLVNWPIYLLIMVLPFVMASARAEREVAAAYGESERLLLNILPEPIAKRLKATQGMIADDHDRVAILFADIVGFTDLSQRLQPSEVVTMLNTVFNAIDELVADYKVEKIKTIGDAYMVVAGLPKPVDDPDALIARLALDIQKTAAQFTEPGSDKPVQVRVGINSGKVVAGVIGNRKFAYDLWGDAVNVAARMESSGEPGRVQVTDDFAEQLRDRFDFEPRGEIEIKGKGPTATSFLVGEKSV